ncbi:MAG: class IV adenylate cyclase [Candidatus Peregrinibacteria bacterium]
MSIKEVEAKAWIKTDAEDIRVLEYCNDHGGFLGEKKKSDVYFSQKGTQEMAFRVREDGEKTTVTQKKRSLTPQGIEINEELEFEIEEKLSFLRFMESCGYIECFRKEKQVLQYHFPHISLEGEATKILVEIVTIPNLGKFLEGEILCSEDQEKAGSEIIFQIFLALGLEKNIEQKPYVLLLKNHSGT